MSQNVFYLNLFKVAGLSLDFSSAHCTAVLYRNWYMPMIHIFVYKTNFTNKPLHHKHEFSQICPNFRLIVYVIIKIRHFEDFSMFLTINVEH